MSQKILSRSIPLKQVGDFLAVLLYDERCKYSNDRDVDNHLEKDNQYNLPFFHCIVGFNSLL